MFFQGLEHTAIATPDPRRLAEWYVERLGFVIRAGRLGAVSEERTDPDGLSDDPAHAYGAGGRGCADGPGHAYAPGPGPLRKPPRRR